jgi:hypothetical protein
MASVKLAKGRSRHDHNHPKLGRDPCHCEEGRQKVDDKMPRAHKKVSKTQIEFLDGADPAKRSDEVNSTLSSIYRT